MSYFFQIASKSSKGMVFSNTEYLCEETTKGNLITFALPSFYKIQHFYGKWFSRFRLCISNNEFLYETNGDSYSFATDLDTAVAGKYYLIIYAIK